MANQGAGGGVVDDELVLQRGAAVWHHVMRVRRAFNVENQPALALTQLHI
jgi:hypothetical protein